jgi:hypothetical protein
MGSPEAAQVLECWIRKWNIAIFSAFTLAHMYTPLPGINVSNLHAKSFSKPKTHAVNHKEAALVRQLLASLEEDTEMEDTLSQQVEG